MPFKYSDKEIESIVCNFGSKFKNKYETFKLHSLSIQNNYRVRYVKVINPHTSRIAEVRLGDLITGSNPFNLKINPALECIKDKVNNLGLKFKNQFETYQFHSLPPKKMIKLHVNVINPITKSIKLVSMTNLVKGQSPYNVKKNPSIAYLKHTIDQLGLQYTNKDETFKFHSTSNKRDSSRNRFVKIINSESGRIAEIAINNLVRGKNPFNNTQHRVEVTKLQPQVFKILKSSNVSSIQKEFKLSKRSRVDFIVEHKNKINVIEVKNDISHQTKNKIKTQKSRYEKDAKNKFGSKFGKVIMVSPKGTNGCYSFKELPLLLK